MSSKVAGTPSTGRLHRVPSHHEMSRFLRRGLPNRVDVTAPLANRKTKIICTIGPSCQSVEMLKKLVRAPPVASLGSRRPDRFDSLRPA